MVRREWTEIQISDFFINSSFVSFYSLSWVIVFITPLCDVLSKMINFASVKRAVHGTSFFPESARELSKLLPTTLALPRAEGNLCYNMGKAIALWYSGNSKFTSTFPPTSQKISSSSVTILGSLHIAGETLNALDTFTVSLPPLNWHNTRRTLLT